MSRRHHKPRNSVWPFTPEQILINRCAMADLRAAHRPTERLLQVQTDFFCAGAVWRKISGAWSCVQTAPILDWMQGMNPDQAKIALLKMQANYQFLSPTVMGPSHGVTA